VPPAAANHSSDELFIFDTSPDHRPFHTVTGNTANWNGGFGITTNLVGGNRRRLQSSETQPRSARV
jgi:hypothetical protein